MRLLVALLTISLCLGAVNVYNHPISRAIVELHGDAALLSSTFSPAISLSSGECSFSGSSVDLTPYSLIALGFTGDSSSVCSANGFRSALSDATTAYNAFRAMPELADLVIFMASLAEDDATNEITEAKSITAAMFSDLHRFTATVCKTTTVPCNAILSAQCGSTADTEAAIAAVTTESSSAVSEIYAEDGLAGVVGLLTAQGLTAVALALNHSISCIYDPTCTIDDSWVENQLVKARDIVDSVSSYSMGLSACETTATTNLGSLLTAACTAGNNFVPALAVESAGRCHFESLISAGQPYTGDLSAAMTASTTLYSTSGDGVELTGGAPGTMTQRSYNRYTPNIPAKTVISHTAACEIGEYRLSSADPCTACPVGNYCPGDDAVYPCNNPLKTSLVEYFLTGLWYESCDVRCVDTTKYVSLGGGALTCVDPPAGTQVDSDSGVVVALTTPADEDVASTLFVGSTPTARYERGVRLDGNTVLTALETDVLGIAVKIDSTKITSDPMSIFEIYGLISVSLKCTDRLCQLHAWVPSASLTDYASSSFTVSANQMIGVTLTAGSTRIAFTIDGEYIGSTVLPPMLYDLALLHEHGVLVGLGADGPLAMPVNTTGVFDVSQSSGWTASRVSGLVTDLVVTTRAVFPEDFGVDTYPTGSGSTVATVTDQYSGLPETCSSGVIGGTYCMCGASEIKAVVLTSLTLTVESTVAQTLAAMGVFSTDLSNKVPATCTTSTDISCLGLFTGINKGKLAYLSTSNAIVLPAGTNNVTLSYLSDTPVTNVTVGFDSTTEVPSVTMTTNGETVSLVPFDFTSTSTMRAIQSHVYSDLSAFSAPHFTCVSCPSGSSRASAPQTSASQCSCEVGLAKSAVGMCEPLLAALDPPSITVANETLSTDMLEVTCVDCADAKVAVTVGWKYLELDFTSSDTASVSLAGLSGNVTATATVSAAGRLQSGQATASFSVIQKMKTPVIYPTSATNSDTRKVSIKCPLASDLMYEYIEKPVTTLVLEEEGVRHQADTEATIDVLYGMVRAWCVHPTYGASDKVYGLYYLQDATVADAADEPIFAWVAVLVVCSVMAVGLLGVGVVSAACCGCLRLLFVAKIHTIPNRLADLALRRLYRIKLRHAKEEAMPSAVEDNAHRTYAVTDVFPVGDRLFKHSASARTNLTHILDNHVSVFNESARDTSFPTRTVRDINAEINWGRVFTAPSAPSFEPECCSCGSGSGELAHYGHVTIKRAMSGMPDWIRVKYYCRKCIYGCPIFSKHDIEPEVGETIIHTMVCADCPGLHKSLFIVPNGNFHHSRNEWGMVCETHLPNHAPSDEENQVEMPVLACHVCGVHAATFKASLYADNKARWRSEVLMCLVCHARYYGHALRASSERNSKTWSVAEMADL